MIGVRLQRRTFVVWLRLNLTLVLGIEDQPVAQIKTGYACQPSHDRFPDQRFLANDSLPPEVHEAVEHYRDATGFGAWGGAWAFCQIIEGQPVYFVFCGTDGDEAWLEVYVDGAIVAAASLDGYSASWGTRDQVRATIPSSE
jgi:hypothetical protein